MTVCSHMLRCLAQMNLRSELERVKAERDKYKLLCGQ